ncbi:MAG: MFS transporter [Verrucomicrobia bacterium]|nr:MAG: MFS transporter [Verrucomicrobiota bacterium]
MLSRVITFFRTGPDQPLIEDEGLVRKIFKSKRLRLFIWLIIGYGFFYTCRLSLSVAKKPMLDEGVLSVEQMGNIGAILLYVYAFGKFFNGFLADRANIRRFMSTALLCSAVVNLIFGWMNLFWMFAVLWGLNGWFQSIGSAPSVVSICQWFSQKERGTRYGVWAGAHNIGEGLTFVGTSLLVSAFGWRWGFWAPGLVCIFIAIMLFRNLADRPRTYGLPHVADFTKDYSGGKPTGASVWELQKVVLKHPIVWVLGLSSATMYMARYAVNSWAIFYLQEAKDYTLASAGTAMAAYPIIGFMGAIFSGYCSDRFFGSKRNIPTLIYGIMPIAGLFLLYKVPPGNLVLDAIALGIFGFGIGGLIVFLAGLIAVDAMPKGAAGAVKGTIGLFSYLAAATQDWISGRLIENTKTVVAGEVVYDFGPAFYFWIGSAIASMFLALIAWNIKPHE